MMSAFLSHRFACSNKAEHTLCFLIAWPGCDTANSNLVDPVKCRWGLLMSQEANADYTDNSGSSAKQINTEFRALSGILTPSQFNLSGRTVHFRRKARTQAAMVVYLMCWFCFSWDHFLHRYPTCRFDENSMRDKDYTTRRGWILSINTSLNFSYIFLYLQKCLCSYW